MILRMSYFCIFLTILGIYQRNIKYLLHLTLLRNRLSLLKLASNSCMSRTPVVAIQMISQYVAYWLRIHYLRWSC